MRDALIILTMGIILSVQILGHEVGGLKYIQLEEERKKKGKLVKGREMGRGGGGKGSGIQTGRVKTLALPPSHGERLSKWPHFSSLRQDSFCMMSSLWESNGSTQKTQVPPHMH